MLEKKECYRNADNSSIIITCHAAGIGDLSGGNRRKPMQNRCQNTGKKKKKERKINSCILIPSLPSRILQQLKSLIQNASLIQSPWKNSIFPKEIHFLGNKKREQEEQIHVVLKENKSHTSEHSTAHKEVICLHKLYLRLKTNVYSVQAFTVSCFTQNPVLATQSP